MKKIINSKVLQGLALYAILGVIGSAAELSLMLLICLFVVVLLIEKISREEAFDQAFKLGWQAGAAYIKSGGKIQLDKED